MSRRKSRVVAISPGRLKVTFTALGAIFLGGLFALSWFVQQRLGEARRDREEMVAARVFDEMEREISAFLEGESERPHYENLEDTNPETWAPFVVGYFSGVGRGRARRPRIVAADGQTSENRRRTQWAIDQAGQSLATTQARGETPARAAPSPSALEERQERSLAPTEAPKMLKKDVAQKEPAPPAQPNQATGSQIIQQLNRAPERRKSKRAPAADSESYDDFSDYQKGF